MATLVFGADGGGTKTAGVLAGRDGEVLARCQSGASNPNVVGVMRAALLNWELLSSCCQQAGCAEAEIGAVALGLAGAGSPAIRDRIIEEFQHHFQQRKLAVPRIVVESDARIALEGAFSGRSGAIVIAGTGSVVLAKTSDGAIVRTGGWGRVLGDEGSGYWIGREAARVLGQHFDGLERRGLLVQSMMERLDWTSREKVIVAVYQQEFPLASIAPLVLEACQQNDPMARAILEEAARLLVVQLERAAAQLGQGSGVAVVLLGGLIDHDTPYARILRDRISRAAIGLHLQKAELPPSDGALLMARALLD